jgi:hypothetical protein
LLAPSVDAVRAAMGECLRRLRLLVAVGSDALNGTGPHHCDDRRRRTWVGWRRSWEKGHDGRSPPHSGR